MSEEETPTIEDLEFIEEITEPDADAEWLPTFSEDSDQDEECVYIQEYYSDIAEMVTERMTSDTTAEEFADMLNTLPKRRSPKLVAMDGRILSWSQD
jgi:hypothetical protein